MANEIRDITRLPSNDKTNAWNTILPVRQPQAELQSEIKADWLVVGAGYAGLAAARRLAENRPQEKIVIVDAGVCGENASGRNSGFAIDLPHTTSSNLDQLDGAHRHLRLARAAIAELSGLVERHDIQCDWSKDGKYHAAVTSEGSEKMLEPFAKELDALNEPYEWVDEETLFKKTGTQHFKRAVYTPGCILMNPAALTRGLADSLPENVTLYENTPVTRLESGNGISVTTPAGSVQAPRMILAANGFSDQFATGVSGSASGAVSGDITGKFVHLALHASLSRPLTPQEQQVFNVAKPWGLTPANAFGGVTMRYTNDHRLLIRQDIKLCMEQNTPKSVTQQMTQQHLTILHDRFPQLPALTFDNTWVGYICMSRNGAPAFGQSAFNVWTAACQNGIGVTKGTISGLLAADMACEQENPLISDLQSMGTPQTLPPRPLVEIGARATMKWELWKNRREA